MDVTQLIGRRLRDRGLEQKDLAAAARVTESYISQLLNRKKLPPAPGRTDIYERIGGVLGLETAELARLAEAERREQLKKRFAGPPAPLFRELRNLVLDKCAPTCRDEVERIFQKNAFGEIERLVTRTVLSVAQDLALDELRREDWLSLQSRPGARDKGRARVSILEFLDTDVLHVSEEAWVSFVQPIIASWDIDLQSFEIRVFLSPRFAHASPKRFGFTERTDEHEESIEPGLVRFLEDPLLGGDATEEEIEFLRALRFRGKRPSPMYYYRELQSLRDPLHFPDSRKPAAPRRQTESADKGAPQGDLP